MVSQSGNVKLVLLAGVLLVAGVLVLSTAIAQESMSAALEDRAAGTSSPVQRPPRQREPSPQPVSARSTAQYPNEFRAIDGVGNNPANPEWGAAAIPLLRDTPVGYADGVSAPAGPSRPSARRVSNLVGEQLAEMPNPYGATDYLWQWGQFLDHDIDETPVASPAEPFDIPVPSGDPFFDPGATGTRTIPLDRSAADPDSPVRQQLNNITAFIDASNVYGSHPERAEALRANDGTGRLRMSAGDLLPYNTSGLDNAPSASDPTLFLAGDIRANEQIALTAMHTLFVREHNHHADVIRAAHPELTGDEVYLRARAIVGAEMQAITYNEFLPLLLGPDAIPPYSGYRSNVNPGITNVFATAAYRVGHTMLSPEVMRLDATWQEAPEGHIPLLDCFFTPAEIENHGIDTILRGLAGKPSQMIDCRIVDDVRNFLFGPPGSGGFDLAALNIQRGRDHGLASFNEVRIWFGIPAAETFAEINPEPASWEPLAAAYAHPDDVDAWVGLLAEPHASGALLGETARRALADQFIRLRDGDRFWYEAYLPPELVDQVNQDTLAVIIRRNTGIGPELPDDVFRVPPPPPSCEADMNGDQVVDVFDFGLFAEAFSTNDPAGDFTGDGQVDVFDFGIFAGQFGSTCGQ